MQGGISDSDHATDGRSALLVMAVVFAFVFVSRGVADSWMVFLLPVEQEFNATRQQTSGVYSAYMMASGLFSPLAGMLLQRFGARVCYGFGIALIAGSLTMAAAATRLVELYAYVGILASVGIGAVGVVPASALVGRWFRNRMSIAMGATYAGLGSGSLVIVPLAQWWIERHGWRDTYTLMGAIGGGLLLVTLLLPWRRFDRTPAQAAAAIPADGSDRGLSLVQAIRTPEFAGLLMTFGFTGFSMYVVIAQVVPFLVDSGYRPLQAALAFGVSGMLSVGGVMLTGWLSHRFGLRPIGLLSFACTFVGILCLLGLSFTTTDWLLVMYVGIFGIAQGARGPIVATMSNRLFVGPAAGTTYGVIYATSNVGAALGAWLSGFLHDFSDSYRPALLIAAIGIGLAAMPFLLQRAFRSPAPVQPPPTP